MSDTSNVFLKKFIIAVCQSLEAVNRRIHLHQQRVTIISLNLANKLNLNLTDKTTLFYAGLLHDIGLFLTKDEPHIIDFNCSNNLPHCEQAYEMFNRLELLKAASVLIRYHHDHWQGPNESGLIKDKIPFLSQILHLADRFEVLILDNKPIMEQSEEIIKKITQHSGTWFNPDLVETLKQITQEKLFWLSLSSEFTSNLLNEFAPTDERETTFDNMIEVASIFAQIVDYKSQHTKNHSVQVTALALKIAMLMHWSKTDLKRLWAAALLHDLGKLSIQDELIDKAGSLTDNEYTIMKMHPYFGYLILSAIPEFDEIARWSLFHHEYLDGKGYPFGVDGDNIPQGARIIAVADKFTALTENRSYRKKLSNEEALKILENDAKQNRIDKKILDVLKIILEKKIPFNI